MIMKHHLLILFSPVAIIVLQFRSKFCPQLFTVTNVRSYLAALAEDSRYMRI